MRTFLKLMAGAATAAAVTAMVAAVPAMADPPAHTTVHNFDVIGVGSDTIQAVMNQFSLDYNKAKVAAHHKDSANTPFLYSWDATNPSTGAIGDLVALKSGCKKIARPDGSGAGITAVTTQNAKDGHTVGTGNLKRQAFCMDFARSSRDRGATDPVYGKGGIAFITLGGDAVTYATQPGSNAPKKGLTTAQLFKIYTCAVTNWKQVGGKNAPIHAFIPQSGSGTRSFFLTAIGITSGVPGTCVSDGATKAVPGGKIEENEGVNSLLNKDKADVIFPYSAGKYIAEVYHSAKCLTHFCAPATSGKNKGKVCLPGKGQDVFSCDTHGTMVLNKVNGTAPTAPFPLPKPPCTKNCPVVNPKFSALFTRSLFVVVPFSTSKGSQNGIAPYLLPIFGPKGFTCTSKTAKADLLNYGFRVFPAGNGKGHSISKCGDTH